MTDNTFLIAALKIFLEHGIKPNFVVDHEPDAFVGEWASRRSAGNV